MSNSHDEIDTAMVIAGDVKDLVLEKQNHGAHVVVYSGLSLFIAVPALVFITMFMWIVATVLSGVYGMLVGGTPMDTSMGIVLFSTGVGVVIPMVIFIVAAVGFGRSASQSVRGYTSARRKLETLREKRDAQGGDISLTSEDVEGGELSMIAGEKGALSDAESNVSGA